jgi:glycosyltransferase involved in cell wall biosynthesis
MTPSKVHVLCRGVGFAYGGVQTATVHLVDALQRQGVNVELVSRESHDTTDVWCEGRPWTWHRKRLRWWDASIQSLTNVTSVITPDPWAVIAVRRRWPTTQVVFTPGELELRSPVDILSNRDVWWGTRFFEWVSGRALLDGVRCADSTVVQCEQLRRFASTKRRVDPARLKVVPYGVNTPTMPTSGVTGILHAELGLDTSVPLVVGVGRHVSRKRFDFLISAFAEMSSSEAHLVLIGDGPETDRLKNQVRALGCDRVHFLGARPNVIELLRECRVMVMCSDYEPFGIVVLEAMAAGCPVITRRPQFPGVLIGAAEYLTDGVDALVVDTHDHRALATMLTRVCEHPESVEAIRRAAFERVHREFTWARYAESCLELLRPDATSH